MPTYFDSKTQNWFCKFYYKDSAGVLHQKRNVAFDYREKRGNGKDIFLRYTPKPQTLPFPLLLPFTLRTWKYVSANQLC